jgi:hypothetical protein
MPISGNVKLAQGRLWAGGALKAACFQGAGFLYHRFMSESQFLLFYNY